MESDQSTPSTSESTKWLAREAHDSTWLMAYMLTKESLATELGATRDAERRLELQREIQNIHKLIAAEQVALGINPVQDPESWQHYVDGTP